MFVGLFLREEGGKKKEERKGKARKRKRGERAETLSSNSRKWVDPDGVDCVPCVDSMSPQSLGLGEEPGN